MKLAPHPYAAGLGYDIVLPDNIIDRRVINATIRGIVYSLYSKDNRICIIAKELPEDQDAYYRSSFSTDGLGSKVDNEGWMSGKFQVFDKQSHLMVLQIKVMFSLCMATFDMHVFFKCVNDSGADVAGMHGILFQDAKIISIEALRELVA